MWWNYYIWGDILNNELKLQMYEARLTLLKTRNKDNRGVIRKLERKIRNLNS